LPEPVEDPAHSNIPKKKLKNEEPGIPAIPTIHFSFSLCIGHG
jgi:hypothetical protein